MGSIMPSLTLIIQTLFSYVYFYLVSVLPHVLGMVIYAILPRRLYTRLLYRQSSLHQLFNLIFGRLLPSLPFPETDLTGKTAIVTGSNSGIGYQLALALADLNCAVLLAVRSEDKGRDAVHSIISAIPSSKGRVKFSLLDTSSLTSVRAFAANWEAQGGGSIDVLIHNAGITSAPQTMTDEGIESIYATNFLGSFLLTHLLEPHLAATSRVIFTTSTGQLGSSFIPTISPHSVRGTIEPGFHTTSTTLPLLKWQLYSPNKSSDKYNQTKGMQCAFTRLLQRRFDAKQSTKPDANGSTPRKTAHAFSPSFTVTPIFGKVHNTSFFRDLVQDPVFTILPLVTIAATHVSQGAMTGLWLAAASEEEIAASDKVGREPGGGGYWDRMHREISVADVMGDEMLNRLWERWEADAGIVWK